MRAEDPRHSRSQHFRATGLGQELAQHGSQGDDSRRPRQGGTQAVAEGLHDTQNGVGSRLAFCRGHHLAGGIACGDVQQQHRP